MSYRKTLIAALCIFALAIPVAAQAPQATPDTKSTPSSQPALAFVNDQPITLADIDAEARKLAESLDEQIKEARRKMLDALVNEILFETEASVRKVTVDKLLDLEVFNRITAPTDAEIRALYDANRAKLGTATLESARAELVSYLRSQSAQKLLSELVSRLRAANKVVMGPGEVNAPNLAPSTVLATVTGRTVTAGALGEKARQEIYELRMKVYDAQKSAVELKINELLLAAEAKRRNSTEQEIIRTEIVDKMRPTTDADVTKFYEENKARIKGDLASRREDIKRYLEQQEQKRLVEVLVQQMRSRASVRVLLTEPEPPVHAISIDDDPSRGNPQAPVTVVMFTDFQCPSCAAMHPVVEEALKSHSDRVRLVVRDYPLDVHDHARKAAEAADAANAQGKFFEYTALLYQNQSNLDVASLKKYASQVGLNRARFDRELDSGMYAAEVSHDIADAEKYGVKYTPTIFINGVLLREVSAEGFQAALERALMHASRTAGSAVK